MEQVISKLQPKEFSLSNPYTPKEIECLGFKLTDLSVDFNKGFFEVGCGY
jgi:hypothetical protein